MLASVTFALLAVATAFPGLIALMMTVVTDAH